MNRRITTALLWIAAAGCGSEAAPPPAAAGRTTQALTGDGTIPRVPNPPLLADLNAMPGDLRAAPIPGPGAAALADYIKDNAAAVRLGKALFWDMQVGSDDETACASCHFRAGADPRSKNQVSPGLKHVPVMDLDFTTGGVNYQLTSADFPLSRLATPGVRGGLDPSTDSNDSISSQGVPFLSPGLDPLGFQLGFRKTRRVEPRNTPTVINAVYNHRQFWDGRAENVFNGVNHVGSRDPNARVMRADDPNNPVPYQVVLLNSSLASQAVAPIVSDLEMAAPGRTALDVARELTRKNRNLGKRVHGKRPLFQQRVAPDDSVLGGISRFPAKGLTPKSYDEMVEAAFHDRWWKSNKLVQVAADGSVSIVDCADNDSSTDEYTLLQYNFTLFFGLAIQAYEATLIADDTPWDRFRRDHPTGSDPALNPWVNTNPNHISRLALFGANLFNERTRGPFNIRCSNCHEQAEMTDASARRVNAAVNGPVRNRDGNIIDKGFNNIGIRPTDNDLGAGDSDAFGPLSHAKRLFPGALPATFDGAPVSLGFGVEGAFKIPSLRNVSLTAPYFHNGEAATLRQVVELYSRGGNVFPVQQRDGTTIEPLGVPSLTNDEIEAIVAFLETLTDPRVPIAAAPFDHPQLFVPNGHKNHGGGHFAKDDMVEIPMTGAAGGAPLPGFLEGVFGP